MAILNMFSGGGGVRIPLEPVTGLEIENGAQSAKLIWTDPVDKVANPGGEKVAEWAYTIIVRKQGSAPTSHVDGVQVLKSTIRNQYQSEPYVDTGLVDYEEYYYAIYSVTTLGVYSAPTIQNVTAGEPTVLAFGQVLPFSYLNKSYVINANATSCSLDGTALFFGRGNIPSDGDIVAVTPELVENNITPNGTSTYNGARGGATTSHYVFTGTGRSSGNNMSNEARAFNKNFSETSLTMGGYFQYHGIAELNGKVLIAGGRNMVDESTTWAYNDDGSSINDSLTVTNLPTMTYAGNGVGYPAGARAGNYAVFAGGQQYDSSEYYLAQYPKVDGTCAYTDSLTVISGPALPSGARSYLSGVTASDGSALFSGGLTEPVNSTGSTSVGIDRITPDLVATSLVNAPSGVMYNDPTGTNYKGYTMFNHINIATVVLNRYLTRIDDPANRGSYLIEPVGEYAVGCANGNAFTYTLSL